MTAAEYRTDGWPLCPRCGTDGLRSTRTSTSGKTKRGRRPKDAPPRDPLPTDEMFCRECGWNGCVVARKERNAAPIRGAQKGTR
jgi:hypothetical protein